MIRKLTDTQEQYHSVKTEAEIAKKHIADIQKDSAEKERLIQLLSKQMDENFEQKKKELESGLERYMLVNNDDWLAYRKEFSKAYPDFLAKLRTRAGSLSSGEERLAILMFLGLRRTQIAETLGISPESVSRSQRRLRQKLSPDKNEELEAIISAV